MLMVEIMILSCMFSLLSAIKAIVAIFYILHLSILRQAKKQYVYMNLHNFKLTLP